MATIRENIISFIESDFTKLLDNGSVLSPFNGTAFDVHYIWDEPFYIAPMAEKIEIVAAAETAMQHIDSDVFAHLQAFVSIAAQDNADTHDFYLSFLSEQARIFDEYRSLIDTGIPTTWD